MCAPRSISAPAAGAGATEIIAVLNAARIRPGIQRPRSNAPMKREEPIEMFMPPNMLKAKMGGGHNAGLDMAALKRAEQAMEELKGKFGDWLIEDLRVLATARSAYAE